ncbi:MAG: hypothetical protein R3Y50_10155 [Rikenellaceae bacterium]
MIINYNNTTLEVNQEDKSYRYKEIMGDNSVTLYFSLPTFVDLPIGAWIEYKNETYSLLRPEDFKKHGTRNFEYTVTFHSDAERTKRYKVRNPIDGRIKFSYVATPTEFAQLLVDNLNQRESGWSVGSCIEATAQSLSFNHNNCYEMFGSVADLFDTECELSNKTVSFGKIEYNKSNPLPLAYGKGEGFKSGVTRVSDDAFPVEILYIEGGEDNIDSSSYGSETLLLPKNQSYVYEGETYVTDQYGLSIRLADKAVVFNNEDSLDCTHIYPSRIGTVSEVVEVEVDGEVKFYDFIDDSIPDALDYSECLISGEEMTVIFQSGMLATREFNIQTNSSGALTGYDHETRKFELVQQEYSGIPMPSATYKPAVGDKYAVFHCSLPDAYICDNESQSGASWDMFKEGCKYLHEHKDTLFTFTGEVDDIYAKTNWVNIGGKLVLGGYVDFTDSQFTGAQVRILSIKEYINNPYNLELDLSNAVVGTGVSSTLKKAENAEVEIKESEKNTVNYVRRTFRDVQETAKMLEDALLNFSGAIDPIFIRTMQLIVGDESLQYQFVDDMTTPTVVSHDISFNSETKQLESEEGIIQHLTLGINSISSSYSAEDYKYWNVDEYTSAVLTDATKSYYLFIKANKNNTDAEMLLSETAIELEGETGYYHFLVGILNSEYNEERSFVTMYGYTEILPGQIRTEKVISGSGNSYFDMVNDALKLGEKLKFNVNGDGELRIKGTIVQSESGDEDYIGVFRGEYNATYPYYKGDEVTYTVENKTSTYRYINDVPSVGKLPTNTEYWKVVAEGADGIDGKDGTDHEYIFKRTTSSSTPSTPATSQTDDYVPSGWSDDPTGVTSTYDYEWISQRKKSDGVWGSFSTPALWSKYAYDGANGQDGADGADGQDGADGSYFEFRYAVNGSTTTAPTLSSSWLNAPSGWTTTIPSVGDYQYLWMINAKKSASGGMYTAWSTPVRVNGADGADGQDGAAAPVMVYRGIYSSSKTYYGCDTRVDAVKYGSSYYVARRDASAANSSGYFSGVTPTTTSSWNSFGASFESVATDLLLAEKATIENLVVTEIVGDVTVTGSIGVALTNISDVSTSTDIYSLSCSHLLFGYSSIGKIYTIFNTAVSIGTIVKVYFTQMSPPMAYGKIKFSGYVVDLTEDTYSRIYPTFACTTNASGYLEIMRVDGNGLDAYGGENTTDTFSWVVLSKVGGICY